MATYFDPRSWSPLRAVDLGRRLLAPVRLDQWSARTAAWLDPVADLGAGTVTALLPDVLMTLLSEGILSQFGGREVSATLLGHEMTATLRTLEVRRQGAHFRTTTVLADLSWNDHPIEETTVVAHGVRLVPGMPTKVRTTNLDITGTVSTAALAEWLNRRRSGWEFAVDAETGLIAARHRRRRIGALVDATVRENLLFVTVHRATRLGIPVPRRWIGIAPIPLTGLPDRTTVVRADRDGDRVHFRIDISRVSGSFDLAQIRSAIVAGTTLIVF